MNAVLDLFNVLHDPTGVFTRLKEKPRWFVPALVIIALLMATAFVLKPFYVAAAQATMANLPPEQLARVPSPETQALFAVIFTPVFGLLIPLAGAGLLWVTTALTGTEGRYKVLLSVFTHANMTYVLFAVVSAAALMARGTQDITSMTDLRAPIGLDLLAPNAGKFLGAFLNGLNPFSVWGVWLTGTGVSLTHGTTRGTGMTVAAIAFLIGLTILSALAIFQQ